MNAVQVISRANVTLTRNQWGVIIDSFGDVSKSHQCITINATARKVDNEGFAEQEVVRLTIPLTGPARPMIASYIRLMLPGYTLNDWCVWPGDENYDEPF